MAGAAAKLNPGLKRLLRVVDSPQAQGAWLASALCHGVRAALYMADFAADALQLASKIAGATLESDVFLIASGGVVVLDAGLLAVRLMAALAGEGLAPANWDWETGLEGIVQGAAWVFKLPVHFSAAGMGETMARIRATVLRPDAVLGYLRAFPAAMAAIYQVVPEAEAGGEEEALLAR